MFLGVIMMCMDQIATDSASDIVTFKCCLLRLTAVLLTTRTSVVFIEISPVIALMEMIM